MGAHAIGLVHDRLPERRHLNVRILIERCDGLGDHVRLDEREVALDVDDDVAVEAFGDFGNAVRSATVSGPRHPDDAAESLHSRRDPAVIGRDDDAVDARCRCGAPVHVLDHRASADVGENLGRAAGRMVSRGNDDDGVQWLRRALEGIAEPSGVHGES